MTLTEILALLTFLVTTVYDTIDIVLRFREFRTKWTKEMTAPRLAPVGGHSFDLFDLLVGS